jgi:Fe-S cluster assembly protein SufD
LLERWTGSDLATGLSNSWIQVYLEAGASVDWLRLQENGVAARSIQRSDFQLGACAVLRHQAVELGGLWTRHDLKISMRGHEAELTSSGVFVPSGRQHIDTQLAIDHRVGGSSSRTLWKGVAQGRARGVFDGSIAVRPGADGTAAHLKTANLLLSPHAEIDTRPELIIEADEVQCSHGATVGQLDERALFYLRSRGLPEALARRMLTVAFCSEALRAIEPASLREAIEARVTAHLPDFTTGGASA